MYCVLGHVLQVVVPPPGPRVGTFSPRPTVEVASGKLSSTLGSLVVYDVTSLLSLWVA
jgi:hypothetical protein